MQAWAQPIVDVHAHYVPRALVAVGPVGGSRSVLGEAAAAVFGGRL